MELAKVLAATHERYDEFFPKWEKYLNCYQGTNMSSYLYKHTRESNNSLKQRLIRAYYLNYCEPVVDLYIHYIFSKPTIRRLDKEEDYPTTNSRPSSADDEVTPQGGSAHMRGDQTPEEEDSVSEDEDEEPKSEWEHWLEDVDRQNNSIERFMAKAGKFAFSMGHIYVLVDMPKTKREIQTEKERLEGAIRPYLTMYYPQSMVNFSIDERGELNWCRFKEQPPQDDDPFAVPSGRISNTSRFADANARMQGDPREPRIAPTDFLSGNKEVYYKTWTRTNWYCHRVTQQGAELIGSGSHPCGRVPVVPIYHSRHAKFPFFGHSLITDIVDINVAIYNWSSLIDEEIYQKCLNILCINRAGGGSSGDSEELVIGSNNALEYDGPNAPFYLSPATDPGAFIQSHIDRMRDEIFRIAKLGGGLGLETQPQQSGISHAFEFNETNRTVAEKADELERAENQIHDLWHKWVGQEWSGVVDYPDSFSVESFDVELSLITQARQAISSPTFIKELQKRAVRKMATNIPDEVMELIEEEIDEAPEEANAGMTPGNEIPPEMAAGMPQEEESGATQSKPKKPTEKKSK